MKHANTESLGSLLDTTSKAKKQTHPMPKTEPLANWEARFTALSFRS